MSNVPHTTNTSEYELRQARDCEGRYSFADGAHWVVWHRGDHNGIYRSWSKAAAARVLLNARRNEAASARWKQRASDVTPTAPSVAPGRPWPQG
jgi:hypothetical protein